MTSCVNESCGALEEPPWTDRLMICPLPEGTHTAIPFSAPCTRVCARGCRMHGCCCARATRATYQPPWSVAARRPSPHRSPCGMAAAPLRRRAAARAGSAHPGPTGLRLLPLLPLRLLRACPAGASDRRRLLLPPLLLPSGCGRRSKAASARAAAAAQRAAPLGPRAATATPLSTCCMCQVLHAPATTSAPLAQQRNALSRIHPCDLGLCVFMHTEAMARA
jgi:hypothetical protein